LDGIRIKNQSSAHTLYGTSRVLSNTLRQSHVAWKLMGFVPVLDHNKMFMVDVHGNRKRATPFEVVRRERELFHQCQCAWLLLEKSVCVYGERGRLIKCGDGVVRNVIDILALWITDHKEHELILLWHEHQ